MVASGTRDRFQLPSSSRWLRGLLLLGVPLLIWSCGGDQLVQPTDPPDPGVDDPDAPVQPTDVTVSVAVQAVDRVELTDSVVVTVRAVDGSGRSAIEAVGYSAVIRGDGVNGELVRVAEEVVLASPGEWVEASLLLRPDWLSPSDLPAEFTVEIYGWTETDRGQCRAAVPGSTQVSACEIREVGTMAIRVAADPADELPIMAVTGRTTLLPSSSVIVGDLQVDTVRERAYLSNRLSNRLHVFNPVTFSWAGDVSVGSEPWGLHLNATGDTLLVANSGGTSVSHVSLVGTPQEVVSLRLQTRNTPLYEIGLMEEDEEDEEDPDRPTLVGEVRVFDFSDRPQFVAQDGEGRILYSTRPTGAAPLGTVRVIERQFGWPEHETRILARVPKDTRVAEGTMIVSNVDSIVPYENRMIEIWDHRPGFPGQVISSGILPPVQAAEFMANQTLSDIEFRVDRAWELEAVSFADTTYVATSRDRAFVAFGDGGEPEVGRVVLWHAETGTISRRLTVADLVNNASERVRALELNSDGSLGIARGAFGTYFFSNDLRLRGTVPEGSGGGGGAALHPNHPNTPVPGASASNTLAFTVSGDRAVRILDTVHYQVRGELPIRDAIAGPMRVTPPLPSDNQGQGGNCSGPTCVVAKVFAVTEAGGVVVVDVRAADVASVP
jgi:hypothetical protein